MDINQINERLKNLYILKKNINIYNKKAVLFQNEGIQFDTVFEQIEKPITNKLENINTALVKRIENEQKLPIESGTEPLDNGFEPDNEPTNKNFTPNLKKLGKAKTIIPSFVNKSYFGKNFQCIIINKNELVVFKYPNNDKNYLSIYDTLKRERKVIELSDDLLNLILGNLDDVDNPIEMQNYLNLLRELGCAQNNNYFNEIKGIIKRKKNPEYRDPGEFEDTETEEEEEEEEVKKLPINKDKKMGQGIGGLAQSAKGKKSFNPIALFAELYKMLAAKKAGHNNLDRPIKDILVKLVPHIRKEKKEKIIKKYNLR